MRTPPNCASPLSVRSLPSRPYLALAGPVMDDIKANDSLILPGQSPDRPPVFPCRQHGRVSGLQRRFSAAWLRRQFLGDADKADIRGVGFFPTR